MLKKIFVVLLIIGAVAAYFGYEKYQDIFGPNVPANLEDPFLTIPTGTSFDQLLSDLKEGKYIENEASFLFTAEQMSFIKPNMRAGRFKIEPNWSNRKLIQHLRGGKQAPVKVVLTNERLPEDIAGKVSKVIEADSTSIDQLLRDQAFLEEHDYSPEKAMSLFIPNTYELFWNTDAKGFFERMLKENKKFWSQNGRAQKAKKLNMSPQEVYTLASIVERETNRVDEKPTIAGVYLNRLDKGMLLQADPTVVFAVGQFDLRRVLNKHLEYDSPYNTYMYTGLPPGPISMAEISSIDAVLDRQDHEYIFFCAKGDGTGYHSFAKTLSGHNVNRQRYVKNLKARGKR